MKDFNFTLYISFFIDFIFICFCFVFSGLITAITSLGKGILYSLFMFLVAVVLISYAVFSFLVLVKVCCVCVSRMVNIPNFYVKVHSIYRNTGASFAKAQAEFAQGVMRNEHVQQAATGAATAAARQAMGQAFTGGNNAGSGLRY